MPKVKPPDEVIKKKPVKEKPSQMKEKPVKEKSSGLNLNIDELTISNVKSTFKSEKTKNRLNIRIQELDTDLSC